MGRRITRIDVVLREEEAENEEDCIGTGDNGREVKLTVSVEEKSTVAVVTANN